MKPTHLRTELQNDEDALNWTISPKDLEMGLEAEPDVSWAKRKGSFPNRAVKLRWRKMEDRLKAAAQCGYCF